MPGGYCLHCMYMDTGNRTAKKRESYKLLASPFVYEQQLSFMFFIFVRLLGRRLWCRAYARRIPGIKMLILKNKGSCHISALCKANCNYRTQWTGTGKTKKVIKYAGMQQYYLREFQILAFSLYARAAAFANNSTSTDAFSASSH